MEQAIKAARAKIEARRVENNKHFMDWWEATMLCPQCRPIAMKYQSLIREEDNRIAGDNGALLREMAKCVSGA